MHVTTVERSFEPCSESGWYGYDVHLSEPIDGALIDALAALGRLSRIRTLKRPFFTVRGDGFLLRGITGDRFLRAGFAKKDAPELSDILSAIDANRDPAD
ncbi:MAG: hypothetical protein GX417_11905 [Clostridiales bacterium]|nr:hypothetical protein [Clostridiales bacterium]